MLFDTLNIAEASCFPASKKGLAVGTSDLHERPGFTGKFVDISELVCHGSRRPVANCSDNLVRTVELCWMSQTRRLLEAFAYCASQRCIYGVGR